MRTQCKLLGVARSSLAYEPVGENAGNVKIKRLLDELYLRDPCLGSRRLVTVLERDHGMEVNRKRLQRLRRELGLEAIWCKPRTSIPDQRHRIHPYLLRDLAVTRADQVWCADITYIPMARGSAYLCAVMDWRPALSHMRPRIVHDTDDGVDGEKQTYFLKYARGFVKEAWQIPELQWFAMILSPLGRRVFGGVVAFASADELLLPRLKLSPARRSGISVISGKLLKRRTPMNTPVRSAATASAVRIIWRRSSWRK